MNAGQGQNHVLSIENNVGLDDPPAQPAYYLRIQGIEAASIADSQGNHVDPLSEQPGIGLSGCTTYLLGDKSFLAILSQTDTFVITLTAGADPISIDLTLGTDTDRSRAIRYNDLNLPSGIRASLKLTSNGPEVLSYDSNGDGTFETTVTPTASVIGTAAQDIDLPSVTISATRQGNSALVNITSADSGSGVKAIYYSLDGTHFLPYVAPLSVDPLQAPVVYDFADDNVANRSGLVTYALATVLPSDQVAIKAWTYQGRTYAYLKLSFPDSGYLVPDWGLPTRSGDDFSGNALVERSTGAPVQAVTTTARFTTWDRWRTATILSTSTTLVCWSSRRLFP